MTTSLILENKSSSATSVDLSSTSSSQSPLELPVAAAPHLPAPPRRLPSSQYKGVVPQPNGRWGAQIYERHSRVWLGTFDSETAAAKAYDVAAQRFRGRDAATNFCPLSESDPHDVQQLQFLKSHSKSEIVDMLRKHTYNDELNAYTSSAASSSPSATSDIVTAAKLVASAASGKNSVPYYEHLFDKTVTPSDVGKLNRLVVPKQYAEKHFPLSPTILGATVSTGTGEGDSQNKGLLLSFEDKGGKVWRFRYSYWNSSQSYVLTKGWSRFVKEKGLRAGDVISFHRMAGPENRLFIDWKLRHVNAFVAETSDRPPAKAAVRLFGVDLVMCTELPVALDSVKESSLEDPGYGLKRSRGLLENDSLVIKKQCVEA
ncbi:AP2/B3 transcription factor family protein [Rhynchospora pubera]|uniref:AP2/B3 transcription factor family protein n=1 Tax=Rhynchospora pubera TaxID=906938 RepID=A0AAV8C435_9POAL|nr:AP2/B3 transcription factor family protein [Rhynchospora pubera]KAJ4796783.1 AP2/B3 transcription factor family protein [Rhynchospora pubera]